MSLRTVEITAGTSGRDVVRFAHRVVATTRWSLCVLMPEDNIRSTRPVACSACGVGQWRSIMHVQ